MPIYKTNAAKKDNKSQYRVMVSHVDKDGNRKQLSKRIYGLTEARELEIDLKRKLKEDLLPSKITMNCLYREYMEVKKNEVRTTSYEKTKSILKNNLLNTSLINVQLDKLSVSLLQKWKNDLAKKDNKITTKNNAIKELNALLNYAVRLEYLPRNPMSNIGKFKDPYFETAQDKIHYYTPEQFRAYIQAAKDCCSNLTDYACYVFFNVAYYTGMRKGEINALKWSDLDGNVIHVRRSICQKTKGGYTETPPKNKSSYRDLQVPIKLLQIFEEYKNLLDKNYEWTEDMRLCGGIKPISDTNLENHNNRYAELAGLPHIRIHDFRHSHASLLCNEGINIQEVARRLGHADVSMTWNTYSHLYPKAEEKALEVLEKI